MYATPTNQPTSDELTRRVFACTLLATLASKGFALFPALTPDDYLLTYDEAGEAMYLSQGRYTEALLQRLTHLMGLHWSDIYFPNTALLLLAYAILTSLAAISLCPNPRSPAIPCLGGALIACHPFFAALLAFREAALNTLCCVLLLIGFLGGWLRLLEDQRQWRTHLLSALALIGALGCYQPAISIALCITLPILVQRAFIETNRPLQEILRRWPLVLPLLFALLGYALLNAVLVPAGSDAGDPRAQIMPWSGLFMRTEQGFALLRELLFDGTAIESGLLVKAQSALLVIGGLCVGRRRPVFALTLLAVYLLLQLLSILPLALTKVWWPVLRAASAAGFAVGLLAMLTLLNCGRAMRPLMVGWLFVCWGLAQHSAILLGDQWRLNRWDFGQALLITQAIHEQFPSIATPRVSLVAEGWRYPATLTSNMPDHGTSAFTVPWAIQGLLREASGQDMPFVYPSEADVARCAHSPHWPAPGSLSREDDVIHVCL